MDRDLTTLVSTDVAHALDTQVQQSGARTEGPLRGSVLVLIQFDVCEEIRLDVLRQIFGARTAQASFKSSQAPAYVRYQRPPVDEPLEPLILDSGERLAGEIKYYDYGVVSLVFELPFSGDWDKLVAALRPLDLRHQLRKAGLARRPPEARARRPRPDQALSRTTGCKRTTSSSTSARFRDPPPHANDLLATHATRSPRSSAEKPPLSEGERQEILQSRISYYPTDLAVIGWNAAFIYDTPSGAETAIQLLQYANSQLLEFRHYDELLTHELENVYDFLEKGGTGLWSRWRTARAASKLHTVLLDVNELTERADNAIKFLSDMFSARLYKLCAQKVGVPDYKDLVKEKLHTAEDLYRFMVEQFNQSRAFVLELMVVVILIIELIYFFKGHPI